MVARKKTTTKKKATTKTVTIGRGLKLKRGEETKLSKRPGGSSIGEYKNVKKSDFAGPSGGAPQGTYPINTRKRAIAALAYARNAPNPAGIKRAVRRKWPDLDAKSKRDEKKEDKKRKRK